ncbi:MAG: Cell division protein ftsW [Candidatus Magasanikbacteria bacterium GW2011_GWC2_45_8]|uniref:Probable peptidoglycan glycosyltransferase FtsW n=1 Tax=Candidatus Magasanikbacteria bacterium GW2011_GWC2_45_8 TaxID=1619050 RepID=A0A0G1MXH4_9BACT|nr:MAG: Cell division protein ftsW [Candidatus Magasanikbacteria bacterium GW2011_GWC2_45_8]
MRTAHPDYIFVGSIIGLVFFGVLALLSATSLLVPNDTYFFVKRQVMLGIIPGSVAFWFMMRTPYTRLRSLSFWVFGGSIILLLLVLIPGIGSTQDTFARSWIKLFGLSFQPVELAKVALIIFLAHWLSRTKPSDLQNWQTGFLPFIVPLGLIGGLLFAQPDVGSLLLISCIALSLFIVGGGQWRYMLGMVAIAVIAVLILIIFKPQSHIVQRLKVFAYPEVDPLGASWQIHQSYVAVGSGGFFGAGWGKSRQKFQYLPQVQADAIFPIMAEELGFAGSGAFVIFLLFIFFRMMRIARASPDRFGMLITVGVAAWLVGQSFINMATMLGIMPLTGVPLPLVSHGGTTMFMMLLSLGIVANISSYART